MKKTIIFLLIIFIGENAFAFSSSELNACFIRAADKARKSVVSISVYTVDKKNGVSSYTRVAEGSGLIISENGTVVTNHHVLSRGNHYRITYYDGTICEITGFSNNRLSLSDIKTDLAILLIKNHDSSKYPSAEISDSNDLREGEWVIAIGNPYGLKQSITGGIVSSKGRDNIGVADIEDFIQTDVSINPGNSGGPLVDLDGSVVGINTAIQSISGGYQGISFAIPSNIVIRVCNELLAYGRVRRGWLGFLAKETSVQDGTVPKKVQIIRVLKKSPAAYSGLREGDIIQEIDSNRVNSLAKLVKYIGNRKVGSRIGILVSRDGRLKEYTLVLRERQVYRKIHRVLRTLFLKYGMEIDENFNSKNLILSYLSPRSIQYNLEKGDRIILLNGEKVKSFEDFADIFERSGSGINSMVVERYGAYYEIDFRSTASKEIPDR